MTWGTPFQKKHGYCNEYYIGGLRIRNYHPLYNIWTHIKQRCYNPLNDAYNDYGGRGINMCMEWKENVEAFIDWALFNGYKPGLTIERIDNDKGYYPRNCKIATRMEQANNRRSCHLITFNGKTMNVSQWATELGINRSVLYSRIACGWSVERILTEEVHHHVRG